MVIAAIVIAAVVVCALAEWLHAARCRRLARLAFGPEGKPRAWVAAAPWLRMAAVGAACWGLLMLYRIDGRTWEPTPSADKLPIHHLAIALDVSPSMQLTDAGPQGSLRRAERARDVLNSVFQRLDMRRTRVSILAFYNGARPVVIDAYDPEVIANIINDLPLEHAFTPGKTNMYDGVKLAADTGKTWDARSAALLVVSDGDTLPAKEPPSLPAAFAGTLVLGVGNPTHGLYIDGHSSRQDGDSLGRLAARLGGTYCDTNVKQVPTLAIARLEALLPAGGQGPLEMRDAAIAALLAGTSILALLPLALALAGRRFGRKQSRRVWSSAAPTHQPTTNDGGSSLRSTTPYDKPETSRSSQPAGV